MGNSATRRVTKGATIIDLSVKDSAYWVERHLRNWVTWMHGESKPMGLPSRASGGLENYTSFDSEGWTAWENLDRWAGEAANAAIESLVPAERAAIHHCYLRAVYRFPRGNYDDVLRKAHASLIPAMRRKNLWLGD